MPAISRSHIRTSRQSASLDPVGFWGRSPSGCRAQVSPFVRLLTLAFVA
jgi:hypothetical protein